ncbi:MULTISPECIES: hypothetical protein [Salipiger]|uniref:Lipoprotein n=1 Tax=Salipiger profundus TaxID=1229727 RepID=A0A1U7DDE5_9RHOB|nr:MULTISPECIES: hypothetical protein [Salipiger]APX26148.1 hypothetical protein Ga0080559_TMP172 [Salipiger profundus]GGA23412.1 hypothetical protein GCM10011326_39770 [Salipiger profundus]
MIRILALFAAFGALASCAHYREPQANCFAFRASLDEAEPDCVFIPIGNPEDGVEV